MTDPGHDLSEPRQPPAPRRGPRIWIFASLVVVLALLIPSYFALKWVLSLARAPQAPATQQASVVVASYKEDFQPNQPKAGWHYYWNANGPVGDTKAYTELRWKGTHYTPGDDEGAIPLAGRFVQLGKANGHPGQGPAQTFGAGDDNEHAIIIAFSVPEAGHYVVRDSFISRNDGPRGGSVHLRIFVNEGEVGPEMHCSSRERIAFDRQLGSLSAHDTIYVCIGPGETDYHDSFAIDFSIGRF